MLETLRSPVKINGVFASLAVFRRQSTANDADSADHCGGLAGSGKQGRLWAMLPPIAARWKPQRLADRNNRHEEYKPIRHRVARRLLERGGRSACLGS
jgi:hypothetical protein